jgi:hypothetical protein
LIAIKGPSIVVDCFDGSDAPKRRKKPWRTLRRASAASTRAKTEERSGAATEYRQKPSKLAFDFGRPKAGSDALIAEHQPPSAPERFLNTAENP